MEQDFGALVAQHGTVRDAAKAIGMAETTFRARMRGRPPRVYGKQPRPAAKPEGPAIKGRSLDDFRAEFDKATMIRLALDELGDGWLYETEFAQQSGVSALYLGHYRDQFSDHILSVKSSGRSERRIWVGSPKVAAQMRAMT